MTATLTTDEPLETRAFTALAGLEPSAPAESWRRETRLELLAWEIARYEPDLAERLAAAGRRRLLADCA